MPARNFLSKEFIQSRSRIDANGCWMWQGLQDGCGYGRFLAGGRDLAAHRASAHLWLNFDLASKLYVCHHCDNPPCCNPAHLFIGTQKENMQDSLRKGRHVDNRGERHGKARIDADDVLFIRELAKANWRNTEIRKLFGLAGCHVSAIIKRKIWKHI